MTFKDQPLGNRTDQLEKELAEKTVELQSKERELQIESSLEKVRAIALSMMQPADMLEICKTISTQLAVLGVKEIRNVQTAIFHEERGIYFNYEYYAKHDKTIFTETDYRNHEVSQEFADRMLKGAGEFFTHSFQNRKELNEWIRYQKTTNVFIDSFLETAPSLIYYWYSLGPVALGMSTYVALSEGEINLFKRFKNVFELSYRRYLDIEKAEAQAHEARIETSLERVRASAMAMHTTDELKSVGEIIYHELESLGFADLRNTEIIINNNEKETILSHYCDYGVCGTIEVDYKTNQILQKWANDLRKAIDAFVPVVISEKEIDDWRKFREEIGYQPDPKLNAASSVYYYSYSTGLGALSISSFSPISDEQMKMLGRFRNVFTLAYRRYVDVALAEAQARESQIQLALERVRARSLAMHHSTELHEVADVLFQQLLSFGGNVLNAGIVLCKPDADEDEYWISSDSGIRPVISIPHTEDPVQNKLYEGWKNKLDFYSESKGGDELKAHYKYMASVPALKPFFEEGGSNRSHPTWQKWHAAYFSDGYLFLLTAEEYDEEKLLVRFAKIFEQAFTRFLDLQKAEAQAREAQIQLALERIRARTMAMQKSDELSETAQVLFHQFNDLGADPIQITIGIFNEEEGAIEFHSTDPLGTGARVDYAVKGSLEEPMLLKKIYGDWKAGKKSTVLALSGKELSEWVKYRISLSGVPDDRDYSNARRVVYVGFFSKGMLSVSAIDDPPRESVQLLERFAGVFDLTYTRFLDLKQAEAQAHEAQIEAALERVRSRTMGMQKSEELKEVIQVVYEQLVQLKIFVEHAGFIMDYKARDDMNIWLADKHAVPFQVTIPYFDCAHWNSFIEAKQKGTDFFANHLAFEEKNRFYQDLFKLFPVPDEAKEYYFTCPGLAISTVLLENVGLYIENFSGTPYSDEENVVLMRFGKVFQQTYTRFLDLQKAEAQAREAQIETALERVRARTMAMQHSDELKNAAALLFQQVKLLGAPAYSCGYNIWEKNEKEFTSWMSTQDGSIINGVPNIPLTEDANFLRYVESKQKGEQFFVLELRGERMQEHYGYLKTIPAFKAYFDYAVSVGFDLPETQIHHLANFSHGNLLFITLEPCPEFHDVFKRFAAVFEQTYTRFLDLQKAEAQARESQIQLALERVRARTMAMQHSDELQDAAILLFEQMKALGVHTGSCGFNIWDKKEKAATVWMSSPEGGLQAPFKMPHTESAIYKQVFEAMEKSEDFLVKEVGGKILEKHFDYLLTVPGIGQVIKQLRQTGYVFPETMVYHFAFFDNGYLSFHLHEHHPETHDIFKRFAKVFEQTYTRFLDLQKAEAQAREAQIEASLERVRSRAMAMHESSHLTEAAGTLFTELNKLGIHPIRTGFVLLTKESRKAKLYPATSLDKENTVSYTGEFEFIGHPVYEKQYESWQKKENYFPVMEGDVLKSYYRILSEALSVSFDHFLETDKQFGCFLPFSEGFLFTWSNEPYAEDQINILNRFKSILDLTIRRFIDLQKAEAQTRESQIETGLERVRSRTLAMHSSDELAETAAVVFRQLINLGIEPNRLYIAIIKDEDGDVEFWITDEDGSKVSSGFHANLNDNITFKKMFAGWKEKVKSITIDMQGEELQEYFRHLSSLHVPFKGGLSQTRRVQNIAYFSQGFIGIASPDSQPEETDRLLERFASVFNLTYTRFNDLQLAEAQAKKAQMEAAMERVRSHALAMQQPEELMDVAETLRKEMGMLGIAEIETGTIFIFDDTTESAEFGFTAKDFSQPDKPPVTDNIRVGLNETWAGKEFLKFFRSKEERASLCMEGAQRKEWIQYIYSQSAKANNYFGENIHDRTYHLLKFSNGAVAAVTDGLTLSDESWELLQRASSVFTLAYSRFKDLTKARIDLINLKEEKKRSDSLLLNILPQEIADELKQFGKSYARKHDEVTILFADIKGFSSIAETLSAQELVTQLDECFRAFDHIVDKHGLEKIKTVGDAYVCACGLPNPVADHAVKAVRAAIDMRNFIQGFSITRTIQDLPAFEFRIGINTGPVVTGVVGLKKFTYDIWGDAVNMAARMEQHGEAGKINISGSTYALIKDKFTCTPRGKIPAKNKGEVEMYFVE